MAETTPYEQLRGPVKVYIAPAIEAEDAVDTVPSGNWVELGATDEDVEIQFGQSIEYFSDNDHSADVIAVRESEMVTATLRLVGLTHNNFARVLSAVGNISTDAGPPAVSRVPLKRGFSVTQYSVTLRGTADSPFGNFPAQFYIPKAVFDGEPTMTRSKGGRPALEVQLHALEDDTQATGDELGFWTAQTS